MRAFLILLILLSYTSAVWSQITRADSAFIYDQIRSIQPSGTIYYADKPLKRTIIEGIQKLGKGIFYSPSDLFHEHTIKLTIGERNYIIAELKKGLTLKFPDKLFENSIRLSSDSIGFKVDKMNILRNDSIKKSAEISHLWPKDFRELYKWSFFFTKPIYIRNQSVIFAYFMYYTLNGGEEGLWIYRKKEDKWIRWIAISGGAY